MGMGARWYNERAHPQLVVIGRYLANEVSNTLVGDLEIRLKAEHLPCGTSTGTNAKAALVS